MAQAKAKSRKTAGESRRAKGTGRCYERSPGRWFASLDLGRGTGQRDIRSKTCDSKAEAEAYLVNLRSDYLRGLAARGSADSLNVFLDLWLAKKSIECRRITHRNYTRILDNHVRPTLGKFALKALTADNVQTMINGMKAANLSATTIRYTTTILRMVLGMAHRTGKMVKNVAADKDNITLPKKSQRKTECFSAAEAYRFLAMVKAYPEWSPLFSFALTAGLRPAETFGLQWGDIDWVRGTVVIQRSLDNVTLRKWTLGPVKTETSERTVKLQTDVVAQLRAHLATQDKIRKAAPHWTKHPNGESCSFVFCDSLGAPLHRTPVGVAFKKLIKQFNEGITDPRHKLPLISLYGLRHTCATLALKAGTSPKIVSEKLGHANIKMTMDVYSHCMPGMQADGERMLEELLAREAVLAETLATGLTTDSAKLPVLTQ
jgi:integrase